MKGRKKKYIIWIVILLLAAALAGLGIYFYPKWKAAGLLHEKLSQGRFAYEVQVELDKKALEEGQAKVLDHLTKLTGFQEDALFTLTIRGVVEEDKIYALIYPKGSSEPLLELYLSDDLVLVNEMLPYNTIRKNLTAKFGVLDYVMPAEQDDVYMTLEQVERLFDLDLESVRNFNVPIYEMDLSRLKCFMLLMPMSRRGAEQEDGYEMVLEGKGVRMGMSGTAEGKPLTLEFQVQDIKKTFDRGREFLSKLEIELPWHELEMLKSVSVVMAPGEGKEIVFPSNLVEQEKVDLLVKIRDMIRKVVDFVN